MTQVEIDSQVPEGTQGEDDEATEPELPTVREYIVFEETTQNTWKRLESINAGSAEGALKAIKPSENKRYAVVAGRYWQVGKPKVRQVTQVSIEFE